MSDLIKREDAISAVTIAVLSDKDEIEALKWVKAVRVSGDLISRADAVEACCRGWNNTAEDCIRNIKALPSADAVQGEWVDTGNWMGIECSRCKCHSRYVTPFCPQCGARMKGGDSE